MHYQVICTRKCLLHDFNNKKKQKKFDWHILMAKTYFHQMLDCIKKPIPRSVLKIKRLVLVLTPHWDEMGQSDLLRTSHEISQQR